MLILTRLGWCLAFFGVVFVCLNVAQGEHVAGHTSNSADESKVESFLNNLFGIQDTSTRSNDQTKDTSDVRSSSTKPKITSTTTTTTTTKQPPSSSSFPEGDLSSSNSKTTSSSMSEESMASKELKNLNCYEESILTKFCKVPDDMKDLVFWDVYDEIFSDPLLETLTDECSKGTWCLHDRFDYWDSEIVKRADMIMNSELAASMCKPEMVSCIGKIANFYNVCSDYSQILFTKEAVDLVCHLREKKDVLGLNCFKQTLVSLHVTVADIIRANRGDEKKEEESEEVCESAESKMTKGLMCMENSCPGEQDAFRKFPPWQWFTVVVQDLIMECGLDPTKCVNVLQPISDQMIAKEINLMVGISIGVTVLAVLMVVLGCTFYRRHRRNAVIKEGYQKLLSEGDES